VAATATTTSTPEALGWGNPDSTGFREKNIQKVDAGGITVYVNKRLAELVAYLLNETVRRGYALAGGVPDDWSYANRDVRGRPGVKSNHAWGRALDLNATKNPMTNDGRVHTNIPDWMVELWREWGFSWGGGYSHSRKDPMHFEFLGSTKDAERLTAALRRKQAATPHPVDVRRPRKPAPKQNPYAKSWQRAGAVVGYGAHGEHVKAIQWAAGGLVVDGDFGEKTVAAIKRFQKAHGLKADGLVGDETLAVLKKITR